MQPDPSVDIRPTESWTADLRYSERAFGIPSKRSEAAIIFPRSGKSEAGIPACLPPACNAAALRAGGLEERADKIMADKIIFPMSGNKKAAPGGRGYRMILPLMILPKFDPQRVGDEGGKIILTLLT